MRRTLLLLTVLVVAAVAAPASAGGGCHTPGLTDDAARTVELVGGCFAPTVTRVAAGDVVTFDNVDKATHRLDAPGGWGPKRELGPGDEVAFRFDRSGVYPYSCFLHPGMTGAVVVGDGLAAAGDDLGVTRVTAGAEATGTNASTATGSSTTSTADAAEAEAPSRSVSAAGLGGGAVALALLTGFALRRRQSSPSSS